MAENAQQKRDRKIRAARAAAEKLKELEMFVEAESVLNLIRAFQGSVEMASRLYHDNMALRDQIRKGETSDLDQPEGHSGEAA